jgi:hypothetical protein
MRAPATAAAIAATALLAAAGAAGLAAAQSSDLPHEDGDDSRSLVDIASVRGTHDRAADALVHVVRTHDPISPRNFRNAVDPDGPPGSVCVSMWTKRTPWEESPDYDVCVSANRTRTGLRASVARHRAGGGVRRVGSATAELTSPRRLVVSFDPDLIRRPGAYRWSVQSTTFERGCSKHLGCEDFAPARGRSVRTKLGARAS